MTGCKKSARLTVDLGDQQLYRAIRQAAIERDYPVRQIAVAALREWLERQEELDDLAALAETENDPTLPWEDVRAEMHTAREERRAGFG